MTKLTNQTNQILQTFKVTLISDNVGSGTVRSYLSDTNHFLNWFLSHDFTKGSPLSNGLTKAASLSSKTSQSFTGLATIYLKGISRKTVDHYYEHLVDTQTPRQTLNRRLSSLRKFGAFCVSQGWLTENYFVYVKNMTKSEVASEDKYNLTAYRRHLFDQGNSSSTIKSYLSDVKHFINWQSVN